MKCQHCNHAEKAYLVIWGENEHYHTDSGLMALAKAFAVGGTIYVMQLDRKDTILA